jgi:hypothetical protein
MDKLLVFRYRAVAFLACVCVITPLARAQSWAISNTQKIIANTDSDTPEPFLSPAGELYVMGGHDAGLTKFDSTGKILYTVPVSPSTATLFFDPASNVYLLGVLYGKGGVIPTPGAYRSAPSAPEATFV